jgi:hypothetical protein
MSISNPGRGLVRCLGVTAAAVFALAAASHHRAEALSLASPGTAPSAKFATDGLTTEVQHRGGMGGGGFRGGGGGFHGGGFRGGGGGGGFHGGGFRGGGAAFHGGGFRGGGAAFHGGGFRGGGMAIHRGGFRAAPVFHGGGHRFVHRHAFHRPHFHHRRHFHSRFYLAPAYYTYPAYYYPRRCRVILTYYGPRKICRPWWRHRYYAYRYW